MSYPFCYGSRTPFTETIYALSYNILRASDISSVVIITPLYLYIHTEKEFFKKETGEIN